MTDLTHDPAELTFEQQKELTAILEDYRNNPSNSNKYRYNLFAKIDEYLAQATRRAEVEGAIRELENLGFDKRLDDPILYCGEDRQVPRKDRIEALKRQLGKETK